MRFFDRVILLAFVLWCAATMARGAHAQSVFNGDFNCSVTGWTYAGDFSWASLNYVGGPGSGSGRMVVSEGTAIYTGTASQCIGEVEGSTHYRWGSWVYITGCETNEGDVCTFSSSGTPPRTAPAA